MRRAVQQYAVESDLLDYVKKHQVTDGPGRTVICSLRREWRERALPREPRCFVGTGIFQTRSSRTQRKSNVPGSEKRLCLQSPQSSPTICWEWGVLRTIPTLPMQRALAQTRPGIKAPLTYLALASVSAVWEAPERDGFTSTIVSDPMCDYYQLVVKEQSLFSRTAKQIENRLSICSLRLAPSTRRHPNHRFDQRRHLRCTSCI